MSKNTIISLGDHFDHFINDEIASGRYNSPTEVIRTALRLLESEEEKIVHLRKELEIGEKSGWVENFDREKRLEELRRKYS